MFDTLSHINWQWDRSKSTQSYSYTRRGTQTNAFDTPLSPREFRGPSGRRDPMYASQRATIGRRKSMVRGASPAGTYFTRSTFFFFFREIFRPVIENWGRLIPAVKKQSRPWGPTGLDRRTGGSSLRENEMGISTGSPHQRCL